MRTLSICALLAATLSSATGSSLPRRDYASNDYYAIHIDPSSSPSEFARLLGLEYEGPLGSIADHHLFKSHKTTDDIVNDAVQELKRRRRKREIGAEAHMLDSLKWSQKQQTKPRMWKRGVIPSSIRQQPPPTQEDVNVQEQKRIAEILDIDDPLFHKQWHLFNTADRSNSLNVTGIWQEKVTGVGATVCIVDDGLDMDSEDLKTNYEAKGSYDFNDHVPEPKPRLSDDRHGTRCAGEVSAVRNNACGVGVAYDSKISGVRILSGDISDADEALAIIYEPQVNDIYSCSWGPPDDGRTMQGPGILIEKAMVTGVQQGRGGKGSIYVFAAGNGAANDDNCNFDGYTNSIYSVTVGAIDHKNNAPYYSEKCSAQLVVTYSSGSGENIHTTDVGTNKCSDGHGGTSAAGPLAAGIYALLLQVNPDLSWRDIQWLTVLTAVKFEETSDWQKTPLGVEYSHQFGFGKLDAGAIVYKARDWKLVKPQAWFFSPWQHVKHDIPQGEQGLASTFTVTADDLNTANLETVEHITLTMNVEHSRRGDISVELRSPSGIISHLATARKNDEHHGGYDDWTFMSVAHWGEKGLGDWTVIVKDTKVDNHNGSFTDWKLRLWGECIDPSKQTLLPIPTEHDDDDHDVIPAPSVFTTEVAVPTVTQEPAGNPTDHIERPVNQKPTVTGDVPAPTSDSTTGSNDSEDENFNGSATPTDSPESAAASSSPSAAPDNLLPSPFPTFGVSKRTQIWIYGAVSLILIFVISLSVYFFLARRKRLRNDPHSGYEFNTLPDDEDERAGLTGTKRRSRRAGELYDAFAGESDDDILSDEEDDAMYRDEKTYAIGGDEEDEEDDAGRVNEHSRLARG